MPRRSRRPLVLLERVAEQHEEEGEGGTGSTETQGQVTLRVPPLDSKTPVRKISGASIAGSGGRPSFGSLDSLASRRGTGLTVPGLQVRRRSRPLFATLGKRVSAMVKVKMAFSRKNKLEDVFEKDEEKMAAIHEMPKQPRFSSFLSPEAQYAMMKGYEDELYSRVVSSHPEYRSLLRRNQTPLHLEGIRRRPPAQSRLARTLEADEDREDLDGDALGFDPEDSSRFTSPGGGGLDDDDGDDDYYYDEEEEGDDASEKNSKKSGEESASVSSMSSSVKTGKRRSSRLPPLVPRERRLVLTYRMESAMDILDTLRRRKGHYAISPRVLRQSRHIVPVRDYHSWLQVWSKEFSTGLHL